MLAIELPDDVVAALAAAASERDMTAEELAAQVLTERFSTESPTDALASFIGSIDSGDPDWATTDTAVLRRNRHHRSFSTGPST